ncbi:MAG: CarD family transcriptional regulator [Vulcanimicrobiota bacterium]
MSMILEEGSKIFHSLHGLGTVESIEEKIVLGRPTRFTVSSFGDDGLKIMINLDRKDSMVRPVVETTEVPEIMEYLQRYDIELPTKAPTRYTFNLNKLKTGDVFQLCEVIKSLTALSTRRKLSPKDQTMLEKSRRHLAEELGYVYQSDPGEMEARIDQACRFGLN